MQHFRALKQKSYDELKQALVNAGEIDRLMKTASLFLATCRLIEDYTELKMPFTYEEFFKIACDKIKFQVELISKTDKLATFFKAMDVMIDTKAIRKAGTSPLIHRNESPSSCPEERRRRFLFLQEPACYSYASVPSIRSTHVLLTIRKTQRSRPSSRTSAPIPVTWLCPCTPVQLV